MNAPSLYSETTETQNELFTARLIKMKNGVNPDVLTSSLQMIEEIRKLKQEKDVVILSHYYMPAALQITEDDGGVADFVGDSLGLSLEAAKVKAKNIVFCGVKFMAETAHILNPGKKVFLPSHEAGCSLASSITGSQVRELKAKYPGVPVVAYINTYAETKAECDICCTSRNAVKIAQSFDSDKLIFLPDQYMGGNLSNKFFKYSGKEMIIWNGSCEVHEQFTENIPEMQEIYPAAEVLLHWEVPDETVNKAFSIGKGMIGSTSDIINYVGNSPKKQFILGSECDLGAALKGLYPDRDFITPCIVCQHMKRIQLKNTLETLRAIGTPQEEEYVIHLDEKIREKAWLPIKRMIDLS